MILTKTDAESPWFAAESGVSVLVQLVYHYRSVWPWPEDFEASVLADSARGQKKTGRQEYGRFAHAPRVTRKSLAYLETGQELISEKLIGCVPRLAVQATRVAQRLETVLSLAEIIFRYECFPMLYFGFDRGRAISGGCAAHLA